MHDPIISPQEDCGAAGLSGPVVPPETLILVHRQVERQAQRTPEAIAVESGPLRRLTYRALDTAANQLAHYLRARGVGGGDRVGVCVERSPAMASALLGVLKAGAAYVPLDPNYPQDRLRYVLEDVQATLLISEEALLPRVAPTSIPVVCLDRDEREIASSPTGRVDTEEPTLAHVIYTSGSTGRPKGVEIEHRALANLLRSMQREIGVSGADRLLAVTTLSFDIAGLEMFLPLVTGATVVVAPRMATVDGEALAGLLRDARITVMQATPVTWRLLIDTGWTGLAGLKALCGGEALLPQLAAQLVSRCDGVWNLYGPTETTIYSTGGRVRDPKDVHIGRPIDNTDVLVVDGQLRPVSTGTKGELLIGGQGLARGYFNRPSLTDERFVPHPTMPGARMYRTGDLARIRPDGAIDYLGRIDSQVKIRGFRIELGEIEAVLSDQRGVRQAVVSVREHDGDKQLVAYVVRDETAAPSTDEMKIALRRRLPEYMVPSAIVHLEQLPLTPNGKVDRKALPPPQTVERAVPVGEQPPATGRSPEQRLASIYCTVLGVPHVGADQSFFDLGGHSLLAVRLMAEIEVEFGVHIPVSTLFRSPTVAGLVMAIERFDRQNGWHCLVPIDVTEGRPNLFLVHGAGGNVLLYRDLARAIAPDVSTFGLQSRGLDRHSRPIESVAAMAVQYVDEVRRFQPTGPYHLGGYCMGGLVAFEMARLLRAEGAQVGLVALLDTYNFGLLGGRVDFLQPSHWLQWLAFQVGNMATAGVTGTRNYLKEKGRRAVEYVRHAARARLAVPERAGQRGSEAARWLHDIQRVNDEAAWAFVPPRSDGPIVLIKPRKNYSYMSDPKMGWSDVVPNHLEVVELPMNPHAMLLEPFVSELAHQLKTRIRG